MVVNDFDAQVNKFSSSEACLVGQNTFPCVPSQPRELKKISPSYDIR